MAGKGQITRRKITEQALQLFSIRGYYNTSIRDILDAASITKGGLYGHFSSKEDIWYAVYDEAVKTWRYRIFSGIKDLSDPLERVEKVIENHLMNYLAADVFIGGCFFVNMLVEISGQSEKMSRHILKGFVRFSRLIEIWLEEAEQKNVVKRELNFRDIANFLIICLNGAATLYSSSRDFRVLKQTLDQLRFYLAQLRIDEPKVLGSPKL